MDVLIVGGGMAGLSCARELDRHGVDWALTEASDRLGGRVKTDELHGFRLDHGFQVLLTAYPALRGWIDLDELQLSRFLPGAQIHQRGQFHRLADPLRVPSQALPTLRAPMATLRDRWLVARLSSYVWRTSLDGIWASPETSTAEWLKDFGFSQRMIEGFFRPFFGGIFLERELTTSSRQFLFVYKMFAQGTAALPRRCMQAIPEQLAASLDPDRIELATPVQDVENGRIRLADGRTHDAQAVVVATDQPTTGQLLGQTQPCASHATTCFYFALDALPVDGRWLLLNGDG
ncbi:MAG: NAD(P)/FAD-dependent oxidoreductase, partial [Candidatus Bipolaricaulia bacterium]